MLLMLGEARKHAVELANLGTAADAEASFNNATTTLKQKLATFESQHRQITTALRSELSAAAAATVEVCCPLALSIGVVVDAADRLRSKNGVDSSKAKLAWTISTLSCAVVLTGFRKAARSMPKRLRHRERHLLQMQESEPTVCGRWSSRALAVC